MDMPFAPYQHCLLFTASAFARIINKVAEPFFSEVGMTTTHAFILMTVVDRPGISVAQLAEIVLLDPSTVTRALDKMERDGLVIRNARKRGVEVLPNAGGLRRVNDARAAWGKLHDELGYLYPGEEDRRVASDLARCMVRYFERD
jgi:DNA-binding MarR family transcriptional regulator